MKYINLHGSLKITKTDVILENFPQKRITFGNFYYLCNEKGRIYGKKSIVKPRSRDGVV